MCMYIHHSYVSFYNFMSVFDMHIVYPAMIVNLQDHFNVSHLGGILSTTLLFDVKLKVYQEHIK